MAGSREGVEKMDVEVLCGVLMLLLGCGRERCREEGAKADVWV